jgi:hypothetical protein
MVMEPRVLVPVFVEVWEGVRVGEGEAVEVAEALALPEEVREVTRRLGRGVGVGGCVGRGGALPRGVTLAQGEALGVPV